MYIVRLNIILNSIFLDGMYIVNKIHNTIEEYSLRRHLYSQLGSQ